MDSAMALTGLANELIKFTNWENANGPNKTILVEQFITNAD